MADKGTVIYNFSGLVLKSKTTQFSASATSVYFVDRTDYDAAGRPSKLFRQINTDAEKLLVQYEYNELGQLVDKKLHNTGGTAFLQSIDYRYTIRGWLRSINGAQLTTGADNDDTNDYFGL
ncbi:MAG: hypothetical protein IPJ20_23460, partial [Flammeovirgaceae bacterium]|nr:hypothetical protein [Flammeovirgaceae bacterium]